VNSHFHDDHIRGDQVFAPETHIISSTWTRDAILENEPIEQADAKSYVPGAIRKTSQQLKNASAKDKPELQMWLLYFTAIDQSLPSLKITLPDITFSDSLWIYGSKKNAKLIECKNGHTKSDVVLLLPQDSIAFMGDILFSQRHPWFGDGDPTSLMHHLQKFENDFSITTYVPGHGPVAGKTSLDALIHYIQDLQQIVQSDVDKGMADSVIAKEPAPAIYSSWWFERFYPDNLEFLAAEMKKQK